MDLRTKLTAAEAMAIEVAHYRAMRAPWSEFARGFCLASDTNLDAMREAAQRARVAGIDHTDAKALFAWPDAWELRARVADYIAKSRTVPPETLVVRTRHLHGEDNRRSFFPCNPEGGASFIFSMVMPRKAVEVPA